MLIDKKLNLIVPIIRDDGQPFAYIHSTPLSRLVFDQYFVVIAKAFAAIYNEGLATTAGPRIAALMLRKVAEDAGAWDGDGGVRNGLMAEIRRLSNIVMPGPGGWQTLPLQVALDQQVLTDEEIAWAEGKIVFFILASAMHDPIALPAILGMASRLWNSRVESSSFTEFVGSLPKSMPDESTGATAKASSIPS